MQLFNCCKNTTADPETVATSVLAQDDAVELKDLFTRAKSIIGDDDRLGDIWNDIDTILCKYDGCKDTIATNNTNTISTNASTNINTDNKVSENGSLSQLSDEMEKKQFEILLDCVKSARDKKARVKTNLNDYEHFFHIIEKMMGKESVDWKKINAILNNENALISSILDMYIMWKENTSSYEMSWARVAFIKKHAHILNNLFEPLGAYLGMMIEKWASDWLELHPPPICTLQPHKYFDLVEYALKLLLTFAREEPNETNNYKFTKISNAQAMYFFQRNIVMFDNNKLNKSNHFNLDSENKFNISQVNHALGCTYIHSKGYLPMITPKCRPSLITVRGSKQKNRITGFTKTNINKTDSDKIEIDSENIILEVAETNSLGFDIALGVGIDNSDGFVEFIDINSPIETGQTMTQFFLEAVELNTDNENFGFSMSITDNGNRFYCAIEDETDTTLYCQSSVVTTNQQFIMHFEDDENSPFRIQSQILAQNNVTNSYLRHDSENIFHANALEEDADVFQFA